MACGWGLAASLIICCVRRSSCCAMKEEGSVSNAFWNWASASSSLPASRRIWPRCTSRRRRQEAGPLKRGAIAQIFRLLIVGLLEIVEGLLVVLPRLGVLALFRRAALAESTFLAKTGSPRQNSSNTRQSRTDQASHQAILTEFSLAGEGMVA